MTDQRSLSTYTQIFSPKKTFSPVKNTSRNIFHFCFPIFYTTFQCKPYNIFKQKLNYLFTYGNLKKQASKVAHNWPKPFFSQSSPAYSPQPRIDFSYYKYVPRVICLLICGLVYNMFLKLIDSSSKCLNENHSSCLF